MNVVLGEILPLAVGIAISPVPIIAALLMLMSPAAKRTAPLFLIGWLVGIAVAVTVFALLGGLVPEAAPGASKPVLAVVQLVLGALLLLLAVRQWRSRPAPGEQADLPGWMAGIDAFSPVRAFALAAALAALNPKNLMLAASAGVSVAKAGQDVTGNVAALAVWVLIAGASVAVPVVGALVAPGWAGRVLGPLRQWLEAHNAAVMTVLFLVLGANLLGKGIGAL
ncbi:MAG: GAP family protein [Nocardioides sp.]|uniref:GAP family protein n=1 Tax=Nocardioides sp. TaxID=35761 RepID=UPI003F0EFA92